MDMMDKRMFMDSPARKKCLPYGKPVTSDVHNWDPDTKRDTEKKSERKQKGLKGGGGKEERRGAGRPEAGKLVYTQTESCIAGD
ncbi:hypothetical protein EYF80_008089 [Liparis tanakae]|uniref:Uncharacterized protein n=1 Tax=Liparis tanakae TaxID=230148 RepID=A0A4Z2IWL1_9TELE|nr:hypothetical protein EYF80_008089 [Liparis tanakae]